MRIFIISLFILICSITTYSQSLRETTDSVRVNIENQNYKNALSWAEKAFLKAENEYGKNDTNYVSSIRKLVEINYALKNYDKALFYSKLDSERTKAVYGEKNIIFAQSLLNQAQIYLSLKQLNDAENLALKSSNLYRSLLGQYSTKYADALMVLALIYNNEQKGVEASQTYYKILQSIKENYGISHESYPEIVSNLSQSLESKELYLDDEEFLLRTMNEYKEKGADSTNNYAYACFDLGRLYAKIGRELESEALLKFGLQKLIPQLGEKNQVIMNNYYLLAYDYAQTNKYSEAEFLFKKLLNFNKQIYGENSIGFSLILNRMSMLYLAMNRFKDAEEYCNKSLDILKNLKMEKSYIYSVNLNSLADIYLNTERYEQCMNLYNDCDKINRELYGEDYPDKFSIMNNKGELLKNMGKYKESEIIFSDALRLMGKKSTKINSLNVSILNNLAEVLEFEGYYDLADSIYNNVLNLKKKFKGEYHPEYVETMGLYARSNESKGDFEKADKYFLQVLDIYLRNFNIIFPVLSEINKSYFISPIQSFFEHFCSYAVKRAEKNPSILSELFNYRIRTKSLLFNSNKKVYENILNSGDSSLIKQFYKWLKLRDEISRYHYFAKDDLGKRGINIDSLNNSANKFEKELSDKSDGFNKEFIKRNYKWEDIRNTLGDNEAAIEIIRFRIFDHIKNRNDPSVKIPAFLDSIIYAALIVTKETKNNPELVLIRKGNLIEEKSTLHYANTIRKLRESINNSEDNAYIGSSEKTISEVFNIMWKEINNHLKGIKTIYLSLDGAYNKINLNTLFNPVSGQYVFDEKNLIVLTNISDMINNKSNITKRNNNAILFGDPQFNMTMDSMAVFSEIYDKSRIHELYDLSKETNSLVSKGIASLPETEKELLNISDLLKKNSWDVKEFTGTSALEDAVKSVNNPGVLLLATHCGFLKDIDIDLKRTSGQQTRLFAENPLLRSFILFAGADNINKKTDETQSTDDGVLTAYETMNLNLDNTELVVLSGCDAGLDNIRNGENIYYLQNAFRTAGAKSIIMSLWNVRDEQKQEFITTFYDNWLTGKTKSESFRNAQLKLKEKYNNAGIWGSFVMVGE